MKLPQHLEYRALTLLNAVVAGQNSVQADYFSALFAGWPMPASAAARLLAAHANTARGRDVLWLIGVVPGLSAGKLGQKPKIPGAQLSKFEDWMQAIIPYFDGLVPNLHAFALPWGASDKGPAKQVIALLIETGRAPFVVRQAGKRSGLEVPWWNAEARVIRSAARQDLIKLLVPLQDLPQIEVLEAELTFYKNLHASSGTKTLHRWTLDGSLYIIPQAESRTVIPLHRCRGGLTFLENSLSVRAQDFNLTADKQTSAIRITDSAVLVEGLGRVFVYCSGSTTAPELPWRSHVSVNFDLSPAGTDHAAIAMASLYPEPTTESNQAGRWKL